MSSRGLLTCVLLLSFLPGGISPAEAASKKKERKARSLAREASKAFDAKDYAVALEKFGKANQLVPKAAFLFNIGQCHLGLEHYDEAIQFFRAFLDQKPNLENREDVERLIRDAEEARRAQTAERRRAPSSGKPPPAAPQTDPADSTPPVTASPSPPVEASEPAPSAEAAPVAAPERVEPAPPPLPQVAAPAPQATSAQTSPPPEESSAFYEEAWFWVVVIGVAAVAGGVAIAASSGGTRTVLPTGDLGVIDAR